MLANRLWALICLSVATAIAVAAQSGPATAGPLLDRAKLGPLTFSEEFDGARLDVYDPLRNPHGRWKTCYWFGWQPGGACVNASSRDVGPADPSIASDKAYNGLDPFTLVGGQARLTVLLANPADPRNDGKSWAFGMLTTQASFSQRYGYFEMRASLPGVRGSWPAFWMLPANLKTPQEIDIVENMGVDPAKVLFTAHWQAGGMSQSWAALERPVTAAHTYGLLWTAAFLAWYIDGREVNRVANRDLHDPMYLLISGGVGGWEGSGNLPVDAARLNGAAMSVDYVRAYRLAS
jgi:hypothetical protein